MASNTVEVTHEIVKLMAEKLDAIEIMKWCAMNEEMEEKLASFKPCIKVLNMENTSDGENGVEEIERAAEMFENIDTVIIDFKKVEGDVCEVICSQGTRAWLQRFNPEIGPTQELGLHRAPIAAINDRQEYLDALERNFGTRIRNLTMRDMVIGVENESHCGIIWNELRKLEITMDIAACYWEKKVGDLLRYTEKLEQLTVRNMFNGGTHYNMFIAPFNRGPKRLVYDAELVTKRDTAFEFLVDLEYLKCQMGMDGGWTQRGVIPERSEGGGHNDPKVFREHKDAG